MKKYNIVNTVHFVTLGTFNKIALFQEEKLCPIIIDNLIFYREKFVFKLFGYVIMQDHVHLLIQLGERYNDISKVLQSLKSHTARQVIDFLIISNSRLLTFFRVAPEPLLGRAIGRSRGSDLPVKREGLSKKERKRSNFQIWQPDFYDFNIYSEKKLDQKLNYIHNNPVKAKLVENPKDYRWSSFGNYDENKHILIKIDKL